ncbi:serine hydrolase [Chitinophaga filiformis]|uniref:serine hydrolase domain-containing protein n=1 Tax=Chitinophaga filiformis TaxID=104663 RepID=UPI001F1CD844|nr:serine hydrolase domain-containing protein [Chitinophaga filiformis]MCF6406406.1 serine hydrolase [Chitinophaga filiformis]
MKRALIFLLLSGSIFSANGQTGNKAKRADDFMSAVFHQGQFSGAVLLADHGRIIYTRGFGFSNRQTKEPFTPHTPCYIGSISKQFTALAIVMLKEKGKIKYDQPIREYFTELPDCYQPVTIRNLLQHTSGLALFDDYPNMTTTDVFNILKQQTSLRFTPGSKFEYCNANYTLLGMLVEKVSGKSLDAFLTTNIFIPCGMKNTYVDEPAMKSRKRAVGYYLFGDEYNYSTYIGGAASVVSTVEDLYKWDSMLYLPTIISKQSLAEIFTPGKNEWDNKMYGKQGYGYGWFISGNSNDKIIHHDGGFAGFRAYIERQVNKHNTIILISNVRHELTGNIRAALVNVLNDQPYTFPKISGANWIMSKAKKTSVKQAILDYRTLLNTKDSNNYYFSERECNSLGYYLLRNNRLDDAIELFKFNTAQFPTSGNVFDSMGEAYLKAGDSTNALASYKKALELDPGNGSAADIIKKLERYE